MQRSLNQRNGFAVARFLAITVIFSCSVQQAFTRSTMSEYVAQRSVVVENELAVNFESNAPALTSKEEKANKILMAAKQADLDAGHVSPFSFAPSRNFFDVIDQVRNSTVHKIIKIMPKAGILHAHDTAIASIDYLVQVTYRDNLWQCVNKITNQLVSFQFSRMAPVSVDEDLRWTLVASERAKQGAKVYDASIRSSLTLRTDNPDEAYRDIDAVWAKFNQLFGLVGPLVTYAPVWGDYFRESLQQIYADNVQYIEVRGTLPTLYDLDGTVYTKTDNVQIYFDVLNEFMEANPDFIGAKMIFAPVKAVTNKVFKTYIDTVVELHKQFPQFLAGFDLVGQEDPARTLLDFASMILTLPDNIKLFLHAGETNWFGDIDDNLIDAITLGTHRIGHGFAMAKHPHLLQLVQDRDIAIEVNPISNQILKLVEDMRNHPASTYFARNIPLVISSDDPAFFEALPLTDDFYQAFVGIASSESNLRTLKKLATNSITYSALNKHEKKIALKKWTVRWDAFIDDVIANNY